MIKAEYIWLDGTEPTQELRSKTRFLNPNMERQLSSFPEWSFDGSSTNQADGSDSDCILKPVYFTTDPTRGENSYLVLCEVFNADNTPHMTNKRADLRKIMAAGGKDSDSYIGFEQEYTFFQGRNPLGWPEDGFPGPFYCGVGSDKVYGREIVEEHVDACIEADLNIYGINAEVMPGQWEFQIGYRGNDAEASDPLTMSDHLWVARYLLNKVSEEYGVVSSFENKPIKGDWNGAGMHTNFSTAAMRSSEKGKKSIETALNSLSKTHERHIASYGHNLHERLTGDHETCSIKEFRFGNSDRGASIRIPLATIQKGYGYIEDRRPGANSDPYVVSSRLLETICQINPANLMDSNQNIQ